jgi:hypothetical protein
LKDKRKEREQKRNVKADRKEIRKNEGGREENIKWKGKKKMGMEDIRKERDNAPRKM